MFHVEQTRFTLFFSRSFLPAYHESLNHNAINALEAHYENGLGTLFGSPNVGGVEGERDCLISGALQR